MTVFSSDEKYRMYRLSGTHVEDLGTFLKYYSIEVRDEQFFDNYSGERVLIENAHLLTRGDNRIVIVEEGSKIDSIFSPLLERGRVEGSEER